MAPESFAARPGRAFPLGAFPGPDGTNFAIASEIADTHGRCACSTLTAPSTGFRWSTTTPVCSTPSCPVSAPARPTASGPADPGTRPVGCGATPTSCCSTPTHGPSTGEVTFGPAVLGQDVDDPLAPSSIDSAGSVPLSLVVDPAHDWARRRRPPPLCRHRVLRGARQGLHDARTRTSPRSCAAPTRDSPTTPSLDHLVDLGITAVELLPVHQSVPESFLVERGLTNYWGYNTIGYFAPHDGYSAAVRPVGPAARSRSSRPWWRRFHAAGLEVLLDVVFNHTAEAGPDGPRCAIRGIDNPAYYRLDPNDPSRYVDTTGCGNSLDVGEPARAAADHGLAAVLGRPRCTSTGSASTSRRRWPASTAPSSAPRRSSTSSSQDPVVAR